MASGMDKLAKELKTLMTASDDRKPKPYDAQAEVLRVEDGVAWVHIPGGVEETPVRLSLNAKKGDMVNIHVAGGSAWITGNLSSPPTDDTEAIVAKETADIAEEKSTKAMDASIRASLAADNAEIEAGRAKDAADSAQDNANSALEAAQEAQISANEASSSAENAQASADAAQTAASDAIVQASAASTAASSAAINAQNALDKATLAEAQASAASTAASQAQTYASSASASATNAATAANNAQTMAQNANTAASNASTAAADAASSASIAASQATNAASAASQAVSSASNANAAASGALEGLGMVENVLGVLNWISEHGTYELTQDTSVVPGKYYFEISGSGASATYSLVIPSENADPSALGYYELASVDEAVSNYVATHIALVDDGLVIQTDDSSNTSRMLVSPTKGVVVYGLNGEEVAAYGANTTIGNGNTFHIEMMAGGDSGDANRPFVYPDGLLGFYQGPSANPVNDPSGDPSAQGLYELVPGGYKLTADTSVQSGKIYYNSINTPVAYVSGQRLYITQSVVLNEMRLGETKWVWKYDTGDESIYLKWIGV